VKKYIRITIITILMVLMAVLLTSCGGGGGTPGAVAGDTSPVASSATPALNVAILNAGGYYFQVHTLNNPGGEIRGQIIVPAGATGTVTITIPLSGANEVPPVATNGTGAGTLVVDLSTGAVVSVSVVVSGMSSAVTASHIHQGAAGVNGPIIVPITNITVG
jgi:hypothetical protein